MKGTQCERKFNNKPFDRDNNLLNWLRLSVLEPKEVRFLLLGNSRLATMTQVPQIIVRSKIVDPASSPTPVRTYSCAISLLFNSPDAGEDNHEKKKTGQSKRSQTKFGRKLYSSYSICRILARNLVKVKFIMEFD